MTVKAAKAPAPTMNSVAKIGGGIGSSIPTATKILRRSIGSKLAKYGITASIGKTSGSSMPVSSGGASSGSSGFALMNRPKKVNTYGMKNLKGT